MSVIPPPAPRPQPEGPARRRGIFLSLGSNVGGRRIHLEAALRLLAERRALPVTCSPIYRTAPVGGPPQGDFLNLAVEVETDLGPEDLLEAMHEVERSRGRDRRREQRWGPRPLDIDLLLFGERVVARDNLSVPHPRLHLRRFVLVPLADLAPAAIHPATGRTIQELLEGCPDRSIVVREGPPPAIRG